MDARDRKIVKPRADGDHQIALANCHIGFMRAVLSGDPQPVRPGGGIGSKSHNGGRYRKAGEVDELTQQSRCLRSGVDDAAAGIDNGAPGFGHQ